MIKNQHKREVFKAVIDSGFDPNDFAVEDIDGNLVIALKNKPMQFTMYSSSHNLDLFTIGYDHFVTEHENSPYTGLDYWNNNNMPFSEVFGALKNWLETHVKEYIADEQIEDPWKNLGKTTRDEFTNSETFTAQEIKLLEAKLDNFPTLAKSLLIEPNQLEILINEVKELRKDLNTSKPKKKWYREFTGLIVEAGKFIIKDNEARQKVFAFFQDLVETAKHLIH